MFLKILAKITRKHLCRSIFLSKAADLRPATLLKRDSDTGFSFVNFAKFLKTPFNRITPGGCFCKHISVTKVRLKQFRFQAKHFGINLLIMKFIALIVKKCIPKNY